MDVKNNAIAKHKLYEAPDLGKTQKIIDKARDAAQKKYPTYHHNSEVMINISIPQKHPAQNSIFDNLCNLVKHFCNDKTAAGSDECKTAIEVCETNTIQKNSNNEPKPSAKE